MCEVFFLKQFTMSRCLFEYMCSYNARKPIIILLPRRQEEAFAKDLANNIKVVYEALGRIDSRKAEAKVDADKMAINALVERTVSHSGLNKMAMQEMRKWLVETGLKQERRLRAGGKARRQDLLGLSIFALNYVAATGTVGRRRTCGEGMPGRP
jgi:hypothetical protein